MESNASKPDDRNVEMPASAASAIEELSGLDWQASLQKLYDRKSQERRPPSAEGDPSRFRQAAAELQQRQHDSTAAPADGSSLQEPLIADSPLPHPPPDPHEVLQGAPSLGRYPHWHQVVGESFLEHQITRHDLVSQQPDLVLAKAAWKILQQFGIETAYVFLVLADRATALRHPWEEIFELQGTELLQRPIWERETGAGLGNQLRKIGNLVQLVCQLSLLVSQIDLNQQRFRALRIPFWLLEEMEYVGAITPTIAGYQPEEPQELIIRVGLGLWSEQFADVPKIQKQTALQRYGHLARTTLQINPHRKPFAAKLAIFLSLMHQVYPDGTYQVRHLLEQIDSKSTLLEIQRRKDRRNYVFSRWNAALQTLQKLGWSIEFHTATYPIALQPAWAVEDPALSSLDWDTDGLLEKWLHASITLQPPVWQAPVPMEPEPSLIDRLTGPALARALELKGLSRAKLAERLALDRSMVTYWIKGERLIQPRHRQQICQILGKELQQVLLNN